MKERSKRIISSAERLFELGVQIEKARLEVVRLRELDDKSALIKACERYSDLEKQFSEQERRHLRLLQAACEA